MSNLLKRTIFTVAAVSLAAFLIHGCSSDECPTCPPPGTSGGSVSLELMHPRPAPGYYTDAWAAGPNDVFVSANEGLVLRWRDSGWTRYNTGNPMLLRAIWGTSASNVFAVGELGEIVHFDGSSWSTQPTGTFNTLNGVHGLSPDTVYAVGEYGTMLEYDGATWNPVDYGLPPENLSLRDVWVSGPDFITAAGADWSQANTGVLLIYNNSPWVKFNLPMPNLTSIHGWPSDSLALGGGNGQFAWFSNRNMVSHNTADIVGDEIRSIWGTSPTDLWVGGYEYDDVNFRNAGVLKHYNGAQWTDAPGGMPFDYPVSGLGGAGADEVYMCGEGNTLARFDGVSWSRLNDEWATGEHLSAIWGTPSGELWAFGNQHTTIQYDGTGWFQPKMPPHDGIRAAWGFADSIYAVGHNGVILLYDGTFWEIVPHGLTTNTLESIWGTGPNDIWVGAGSGEMLHFDGARWELVSVWPPSYGPARSLWGSAPDDWYAVHYNGALHYDGTSWSKVELDGLGVSWVHGLSATEVFFLSSSGGGPAAADKDEGAAKVGRTPARSNLLRYNGSDYTLVARDIGAYMLKVWALGSDNIFMLGYSTGSVPLVAHYNGSGVSMTEFDVNSYSEGFFCTGPGTAYTAGSGATVMRATAR